MASFRFKENVFNIGETVIAIAMIIIIIFGGYFLINLYLCLNSEECVSTPNTSASIALLVALIAIGMSVILFVITHKHNVHKNRIAYRHRKDQLRNHLTGLRRDYIQISHSRKENISIILNQKNDRIGMMENLMNSSINHFTEKTMDEILFLTEKGLRYPMSSITHSKENFKKECDLMISLIDENIEGLKKKKWSTI